METNIIKKPDLVVALDIGSTYSGYGWQTRHDFLNNKSNVEFNTNWDAGAVQHHKTTSCVLLEGGSDSQKIYERNRNNKDQPCVDFQRIAESFKLLGFGQNAERHYEKILKQNDQGQIMGKWFFFKRFKHLLYSDKLDLEMNAEDYFGQHVPLIVVMSMLIRSLKDHFTANIQDTTEKTLWVVTVPALWSEVARKFMREAAEMCGIKRRNLLLANEPEAAAIYCMFLPQGKNNNMEALDQTGPFLVADLGGLTVDLSALEVTKTGFLKNVDLKVKEVVTTTGALVGGQTINDSFFQVCQESFRGDGWQKIFSSTKPVEMLQMEKDFESTKVCIGTDNPDVEHIALKVPEAIKEKLKNKEITLLERAEKDHWFSFNDMEFFFELDYVRTTLFGETCALIYEKITTELKKDALKTCNILILVGGFSQSPIVRKYITENLKKDFQHVKVLYPTSPFQAVLKGTVIFGHNPDIFTSRISRWTFGIDIQKPFDKTVHDAGKMFMHTKTGKYHCKDIFDIHVKKGESIELNATRKTATYTTSYEYQRSMSIDVYKSDYTDPKYITDKGCANIGYINILFPGRKKIRKIKVSMIYGGTELAVNASDCETEEKCIADIKFKNMENKLELEALQVSEEEEATCTTL